MANTFISDRLFKPIMETKYLHVENAGRYRSIIRFFYLEYEKLNYWLYPEAVFEELKKHPHFADYTLEQCQQDMAVLKEWKNLFAMQDTKKVSTIQEFKNKKFRYQLSEYSVEIERMVIRLENLQVEGTSLEPTLLERIYEGVKKLADIGAQEVPAVYGWWSELNNNFMLLNQNYQDYMRDLNSLKAEEMMKTRAFLLFKDKLIDYLRSFVKSLQFYVGRIEPLLNNAEEEKLQVIFGKVLEYELSVPRLDVELDPKQLRQRIRGRFESICHWFCGSGEQEAEAEGVFELSNDIIRRITRYAAQISEQSGNTANRKSEYARVAEFFAACRSLPEAHLLSAQVFGFDFTFHLKGEFPRQTESLNSGVYQEEAALVHLAPRVRAYKEKAEKSPIRDYRQEKAAAKEKALERIWREAAIRSSYIDGQVLDFAALPEIAPQVRDTFLGWLSKAMENKNRKAKTEDGLTYEVIMPKNHEYCTVKCTDGEFYMPAYQLIFTDERQDVN